MKKIAVILILFAYHNVYAQTYMRVNFKNGNATTFGVANIDSIVYHSTTCPVLTDVDGNNYSVVAIGNRCWMKENLKTTHYNDGTPISTGLNNNDWQNTLSGAYSDYNNDSTISAVYGRLYNWYAVANPAGLCPTGWHVPSDADWSLLVKYIDPQADTFCLACTQSQVAGGMMKSTGTQYWLSPNTGATNQSGFSGLPAGNRNFNGTFNNIGSSGYWWSATELSSAIAWDRNLFYNGGDEYRVNYYKVFGFSVRCLRD